jgi:LytTr DNA-binding domain
MANPFLENTNRILIYVAFWVAYGLLQTLSTYYLLPLPLTTIIFDGFLHASTFGGLGILFWTVVKYGKFEGLPVFQRHINYTALAVLIIGVWIGSCYSITLWLFGSATGDVLLGYIPTRLLLGIVIFLILNQVVNNAVRQSETMNTTGENELQEVETSQMSPTEIDQPNLIERITVKLGNKIHVVTVDEIVYLQADGDYVQIFTNSGKYLKEQTMKYFEENLPKNKFVRVHRSSIVNIEMISRIELYEKQTQQLTMKNGLQVKTSPNGYKSLKSKLNL